MYILKIITTLLFPLFIGLILGAAISSDTTLLIWSLILLIIDIFVGTASQHFIDQESNEDIDRNIEKFCDDFRRRYHLGKYSNENNTLYGDDEDYDDEDYDDEDYEDEDYDDEDYDEDYDDETIDQFNIVYEQLKINGARIVDGVETDEAGRFLLEVCGGMEHAPRPYQLARLRTVFAESINNNSAIIYSFRYVAASMCQNALIFLILTEDLEIRFFTVETSVSSFVLCEYSEGNHLNYGPVELNCVPGKIATILNKR